jgi:hypothetical protein
MHKDKTTQSFGHLEAAIEKMPSEKSGKPVLEIRAHMNADNGLGYATPDNKNWRKEEIKRLDKEIKAISDEIANWDAEKVAERALKSLKTDLAVKRARKMEAEALLDDERA